MVNTKIRLIIFFAAKDGDALYSQQKQDREEKQDHELLIAKFRLKLKKVGKTTRPFRYDLNQIPYDYTEEVRNRFKGLDLIEFLMNYGWRFMTLYKETGIKAIPMEKKCKKSKMAVWGGLTNSCEKREVKSKGVWHPTPVLLPGESQGRGSLVGCRLWGHTESDSTEVT